MFSNTFTVRIESISSSSHSSSPVHPMSWSSVTTGGKRQEPTYREGAFWRTIGCVMKNKAPDQVWIASTVFETIFYSWKIQEFASAPPLPMPMPVLWVVACRYWWAAFNPLSSNCSSVIECYWKNSTKLITTADAKVSHTYDTYDDDELSRVECAAGANGWRREDENLSQGY